MWRYLYDSTFSHLDTIPACDRHTHTGTDTWCSIYRASIASRGKNREIVTFLHHNHLTNFDEIWHGDAFGPSATNQQLKFMELKKQDDGQPQCFFKNMKICISTTVWTLLKKVGTVMHLCPIWPIGLLLTGRWRPKVCLWRFATFGLVLVAPLACCDARLK